eukprot:3332503-Rhodomonas_salina.1
MESLLREGTEWGIKRQAVASTSLMNSLRCLQVTRRSMARCSAISGQGADGGAGRGVAGRQVETATMSETCCRCVGPSDVGGEAVAKRRFLCLRRMRRPFPTLPEQVVAEVKEDRRVRTAKKHADGPSAHRFCSGTLMCESGQEWRDRRGAKESSPLHSKMEGLSKHARQFEIEDGDGGVRARPAGATCCPA